MTSEQERRAAIVRYWHTVEMFSPQTVPPVDRRKDIRPLQPGKLAPWEPGHPVHDRQPRQGHVWQHVVYGGAYSLSVLRDIMVSVYGADPDAYDDRIDGDSALFAFTVTADGRLLLDSPVFSMCAWSLGRVRQTGTRSEALDGFEREEERLHARVAELGTPPEPDGPPDPDCTGGTLVDQVTNGAANAVGHAASAVASATLGPVAGPLVGRVASNAVRSVARAVTDDTAEDATDTPAEDAAEDEDATPVIGPRTITGTDVVGFVAALAEEWGVDDLEPLEVRVHSVQVPENAEEYASSQKFLNSFIAADLARVAAALRTRDPGAALATYLTPADRIATGNREDVRANVDQVIDAVLPDLSPLGRWPANPAHPLVLSQQFAVNTLRRELTDRGLFPVNGPPGTGKTTMLRDVVADIVVRRAERLSVLATPGDAFQRGASYRWTTGSVKRTVRPLRADLTGFEIVLASANNGAVENVSVTISRRDEIDAPWRESADYLAEHGSRLAKGHDAWAAIAAPLGNMKNRNAFVQRLWWGGEQAGDRQPDGSFRGGRKGRWQETKRGLFHQISGWRADPPPPQSWDAARRRFLDAAERVHALVRQRSAAARAHRQLGTARADSAAARAAAEAARAATTTLEAELKAVIERHTAARDAEGRCTADAALHKRAKPSLFAGRTARRAWRQRGELLARQALSATERRVELGHEHERRTREYHDAQRAEREAIARAARADRRVTEFEATLTAARRHWPGHVPDPRGTEEDRERSAPWADEELSAARADLFLAALALHRDFLRHAARQMCANLHAAMDVVSGQVPPTVPAAALLAAWQSLFLVVPLLSTTFASYDRVFGRLGPESLGWLFIDEAGQATPQQAVGALWRSRRAVVVGDPLQLEPITVLPWTGQEALRHRYGVAAEWSPGPTSVQRVSDRTARYGTTLPAVLPDGSTEVWVGAPLRVHRRCDRPMFDISNVIAYGNMMVFGTGLREDYPAPASMWVNVASTRAEGNWIPDEGRALLRVLHGLLQHRIPPEDIFVISPFRDAVAGARQTVKGAVGGAYDDLVSGDRVGTVHTTQGKESDVVILVLGSNPDRTGTRRWATQRPNLMNVAVSRAKRRLYVIGNRELWRAHACTSTIAEALPPFNIQL